MRRIVGIVLAVLLIGGVALATSPTRTWRMRSLATTKPAQYRPPASLITVTVDGTDGGARDQRTRTGPIFGRFSFPCGVIDHLAFVVNRTHWRLSR